MAEKIIIDREYVFSIQEKFYDTYNKVDEILPYQIKSIVYDKSKADITFSGSTLTITGKVIDNLEITLRSSLGVIKKIYFNILPTNFGFGKLEQIFLDEGEEISVKYFSNVSDDLSISYNAQILNVEHIKEEKKIILSPLISGVTTLSIYDPTLDETASISVTANGLSLVSYTKRYGSNLKVYGNNLSAGISDPITLVYKNSYGATTLEKISGRLNATVDSSNNTIQIPGSTFLGITTYKLTGLNETIDFSLEIKGSHFKIDPSNVEILYGTSTYLDYDYAQGNISYESILNEYFDVDVDKNLKRINLKNKKSGDFECTFDDTIDFIPVTFKALPLTLTGNFNSVYALGPIVDVGFKNARGKVSVSLENIKLATIKVTQTEQNGKISLLPLYKGASKLKISDGYTTINIDLNIAESSWPLTVTFNVTDNNDTSTTGRPVYKYGNKIGTFLGNIIYNENLKNQKYRLKNISYEVLIPETIDTLESYNIWLSSLENKSSNLSIKKVDKFNIVSKSSVFKVASSFSSGRKFITGDISDLNIIISSDETFVVADTIYGIEILTNNDNDGIMDSFCRFDISPNMKFEFEIVDPKPLFSKYQPLNATDLKRLTPSITSGYHDIFLDHSMSSTKVFCTFEENMSLTGFYGSALVDLVNKCGNVYNFDGSAGKLEILDGIRPANTNPDNSYTTPSFLYIEFPFDIDFVKFEISSIKKTLTQTNSKGFIKVLSDESDISDIGTLATNYELSHRNGSKLDFDLGLSAAMYQRIFSADSEIPNLYNNDLEYEISFSKPTNRLIIISGGASTGFSFEKGFLKTLEVSAIFDPTKRTDLFWSYEALVFKSANEFVETDILAPFAKTSDMYEIFVRENEIFELFGMSTINYISYSKEEEEFYNSSNRISNLISEIRPTLIELPSHIASLYLKEEQEIFSNSYKIFELDGGQDLFADRSDIYNVSSLYGIKYKNYVRGTTISPVLITNIIDQNTEVIQSVTVVGGYGTPGYGIVSNTNLSITYDPSEFYLDAEEDIIVELEYAVYNSLLDSTILRRLAVVLEQIEPLQMLNTELSASLLFFNTTYTWTFKLNRPVADLTPSNFYHPNLNFGTIISSADKTIWSVSFSVDPDLVLKTQTITLKNNYLDSFGLPGKEFLSPAFSINTTRMVLGTQSTYLSYYNSLCNSISSLAVPFVTKFNNLTALYGGRGGVFSIIHSGSITKDFKKSYIGYSAKSFYHFLLIGPTSSTGDTTIKNLCINVSPTSGSKHLLADIKAMGCTDQYDAYLSTGSIHTYENCIIVGNNIGDFLYLNGGTFKFNNCVVVSSTYAQYYNQGAKQYNGSVTLTRTSEAGQFVINKLADVEANIIPYAVAHDQIFEYFKIAQLS